MATIRVKQVTRGPSSPITIVTGGPAMPILTVDKGPYVPVRNVGTLVTGTEYRARFDVKSRAGPSTHPNNYIDTVLGIQPANLIAYWPFDETTGGTADNAEGMAARDGAYSGVTLADDNTGPFGTPAPRFDGVNDFVDVYSTSLNSAYSGEEITIAGWFKVFNAGVWTDSTQRKILAFPRALVNFALFVEKGSANNTLNFSYRANTYNVTIAHTYSSTDWTHIALTVSLAADEYKAYINGAQVGTTQNGLDAWGTQTLNASFNCIGAISVAAAQPFNGWVAHPAIWSMPLSGANISTLANP